MKNYNEIYKNFNGDFYENKLKHTFIVNNYSKKSYLHKIFIKLELPSIYSSKKRHFKWVKNLGYNILKEVQCRIKFRLNNIVNTTEVNLYTYTEWLFIWNEINLTDEEKKIHNELIGNIPELYDPANAKTRNNVYPVSHLKKNIYKWLLNDNNLQQAVPILINNDFNYNKPPSIPSKILYIPLNFYFCNNFTDILPLGKIEFIELNIELRPIEELYTVLLTPEDFQIDTSTGNIEYVSETIYNENIILPNNINFIKNNIPNFSSSIHKTNNSSETPGIQNLSMFDVLINEYEIKPLQSGNTMIQNFMLNANSDPVNLPNSVTSEIINYNDIQKFYQDKCKISITYNIITDYETFKNTSINPYGIFNSINVANTLNINTDDRNSAKNTNITIKKNTDSKVNEIFLVFRHSERSNKNDLLNFTNPNKNNKTNWENEYKYNTVSYSSNIELLTTLWEHLATSNSIKMGVDEVGTFYIKKQIIENNIYKYEDIINYQSEQPTEFLESIYNSESHININEAIVEKFKMVINSKKKKIIETTNNGIIDKKEIMELEQNYITDNAEYYDFYNKITMYKKYNVTIPGLYYINKSFEHLESLTLLECDFNKIKINNSEDYECILFCIQEKTINLKK